MPGIYSPYKAYRSSVVANIGKTHPIVLLPVSITRTVVIAAIVNSKEEGDPAMNGRNFRKLRNMYVADTSINAMNSKSHTGTPLLLAPAFRAG